MDVYGVKAAGSLGERIINAVYPVAWLKKILELYPSNLSLSYEAEYLINEVYQREGIACSIHRI